jgi:hypothetical protein
MNPDPHHWMQHSSPFKNCYLYIDRQLVVHLLRRKCSIDENTINVVILTWDSCRKCWLWLVIQYIGPLHYLAISQLV